MEDIEDKTMFEAVENHIHILDNVKKRDASILDKFGERIGGLLLDRLKFCFPQKKFYVFVTYEINDSLIIRFHQDRPGEEPYYDPVDYSENGNRFSFYGQYLQHIQKGTVTFGDSPLFISQSENALLFLQNPKAAAFSRLLQPSESRPAH